MPTIDFSTPEQPPGDTRRKVSGFLGSGTVAAAWQCLCPAGCVFCVCSSVFSAWSEVQCYFFFFLFYLWCFRFHPGKSLLCILKSRKVSSRDKSLLPRHPSSSPAPPLHFKISSSVWHVSLSVTSSSLDYQQQVSVHAENTDLSDSLGRTSRVLL